MLRLTRARAGAVPLQGVHHEPRRRAVHHRHALRVPHRASRRPGPSPWPAHREHACAHAQTRLIITHVTAMPYPVLFKVMYGLPVIAINAWAPALFGCALSLAHARAPAVRVHLRAAAAPFSRRSASCRPTSLSSSSPTSTTSGARRHGSRLRARVSGGCGARHIAHRNVCSRSVCLCVDRARSSVISEICTFLKIHPFKIKH
jgi:hypothetical protein